MTNEVTRVIKGKREVHTKPQVSQKGAFSTQTAFVKKCLVFVSPLFLPKVPFAIGNV
jgi:hypothetical protein